MLRFQDQRALCPLEVVAASALLAVALNVLLLVMILPQEKLLRLLLRM